MYSIHGVQCLVVEGLIELTQGCYLSGEFSLYIICPSVFSFADMKDIFIVTEKDEYFD